MGKKCQPGQVVNLLRQVILSLPENHATEKKLNFKMASFWAFGQPWENGYCESFDSKRRYEFLNGEISYSMKELRVLAVRWRVHYNTVRSLGHRPPAQQARLTSNMGHGRVETATRSPPLHTPDGGYLNSEIAPFHGTKDRALHTLVLLASSPSLSLSSVSLSTGTFQAGHSKTLPGGRSSADLNLS